MIELFGYLASIAIGVILGLLGGGGSILAIPILVYIFHVDAVRASAYSLFIVGITSFIGAIPKYKDHLVNIQTGLLFGLPSIATIFVTRKWVMPAIPDIILHTDGFVVSKRLLVLGLFSLLMILAALSMIRRRRELSPDDGPWRVSLLILEGVLIGFITGLVGAGGGFLIIPALVWLTGLPFKTAVGTSLFIIAINSLLGFLGDLLNYGMEWSLLLTLTALAALGILIGNNLQKKISAVNLRRAFGWFILVVGVLILIKEFGEAIDIASEYKLRS
ncbi:MAG TPA: sulfite exporter TauE/SafE family protein [Chryseosolibacter sp.]|nr:sulfite exporter TauE/SafE family protein [Chryseosolibacter sp.]